MTTEAEQTTRFAILQFAGNFLAVTAKDGKKPTVESLLLTSRRMADFVFSEPRVSKDGPKIIPFEGAGQRFETGEKPPTPAQ